MAKLNHQRYLYGTYFLATVIRLWLAYSEFQKDIINRIEITTPLNAFKRVVEGNYRAAINVDPYSSDILHDSPLHLSAYKFVLENFEQYLPIIFVLLDILTAYFLYLFANRYMLHLFIEQEKNKAQYSKDSLKQLLSGDDFIQPPLYVVVFFLLNPYTIFNCVAMTTTVINNFTIALFFVGIVHGNAVLSILSLVLATLQSFYPIILISPLFLSIYNKNNSVLNGAKAVLGFIITLILFLFICKNIYKSFEFLEYSFGFILEVTDQQPNVGVFWYFFMEMFEHFRLLFLYSYQMNVTILYFMPLTIKFRKDPTLLATCFVTIIAIFKSYPSIGDFSLTLALLPCWKHLYNCMQQIFISCVTIVVTTALAPILWDLWIFWGTANANFFFGATLAFITAHIFLVTDISFAYTKREYLLKYGNERKINGKEAKLVLE